MKYQKFQSQLLLLTLSLCIVTINSIVPQTCRLCFQPKGPFTPIPDPDWLFISGDASIDSEGNLALDRRVNLDSSWANKIVRLELPVGTIITYEINYSDQSKCEQNAPQLLIAGFAFQPDQATPPCGVPIPGGNWRRLTWTTQEPLSGTILIAYDGPQHGLILLRNLNIGGIQYGFTITPSSDPVCDDYEPNQLYEEADSTNWKYVKFIKEESNPQCCCTVSAYPQADFQGKVHKYTVSKSDVKDTFCIDTLSTKVLCKKI